MVLKRHAVSFLGLVLGLGACSLLVRGSVDEYPDEDADGDADSDSDSDSDADSDGDGDLDAGTDAGVDAGCPEVDVPDGGPTADCAAFCEQEVEDCANPYLGNIGNCLQACRCWLAHVYVPAFSKPFFACLIEAECVDQRVSDACALPAMQCVDPSPAAQAAVGDCLDRERELECVDQLSCYAPWALQYDAIPGWRECLTSSESCAAINTCYQNSSFGLCKDDAT
ncbi:MAG: hypothetical protein HYY06_09840 [Deltaproteobacteria bacterium]|nr:hypothetical protein [Deltaproteobacteria bacterium]